MKPIKRIHHLSATVGNPNENLNFYRNVLGLKLVKQTVNFEDNGTYHLYFSNQLVDGGGIITFFPRLDNLKGRTGAGQVRRIAFSVPKGSLKSWEIRLSKKNVTFERQTFFQKEALLFHDPHNIHLALIESEINHEDIEIIDFYGIEILSEKPIETLSVLTQEMGLFLKEITTDYYHLEMCGYEKHQVLIHRQLTQRGRLGIGTVHHVAWSVSDKKELKEWKAKLAKERNVTEIHDRKYFYSAYLRDPGRVIYEFATEGPGFTVDESFETLGSRLMLPENYEMHRKQIEEKLPKLDI